MGTENPRGKAVAAARAAHARQSKREFPAAPAVLPFTPLVWRDDDAPPMLVAGGSCLLSKREVCKIVGLSFVTIWKQMREGRFPRARQVGERIAWIEGELYEWIHSRPIKRDDQRSRKEAV